MHRTEHRSIPDLTTRIASRELLIGLVVKMPCASIIEAAGYAGFDVVVIDAEHGAGDGLELEHHIRAADSAGIDTVVRVGSPDPLGILRALDAGATGVIVPHVNSMSDARAAVDAAHYPPKGARSLAMSTRAGRHSTGTIAEHIERARRSTVVIVQIEDSKAVEAAGDIAATPGVDAVWLGPGDLSMSLGQPGDLSHPTVAAAVDEIVARIGAASAATLCVIVDDEGDIPAWQKRGASIALFSVTDIVASQLHHLARTVKSFPPVQTAFSADNLLRTDR